MPRPDVCPGYLAQIEDLFGVQHLTITDRVTVRHWNTAISFAATGRALALCPASIVAGAINVAIVPLQEEVELVTWILYADGEPSPAASLALAVAASVEAGAKSPVELETDV